MTRVIAAAAFAISTILLAPAAQAGVNDGVTTAQEFGAAKRKAAYKRRAYARKAYKSRKRYAARKPVATASRSCLTSDTARILNALEARVGKVSVISTCVRKNIAGTNRPSFHSFGKAVDFNTGNKAAAVAFLATQPVLVMTYANMGHIHFNTGQKGVIRGADAYGRRRGYALAWGRT